MGIRILCLICAAVVLITAFFGIRGEAQRWRAAPPGRAHLSKASAGEIARLEESLPEEYATIAQGETLPADYVPSGSTDKWSWTAGKQLISWRMGKDANIGNLLGTEAEGIRPDTSGKMRFYVIPWDTGDLRIRFQLDMILLKGTDDRMTLRNDETAQKLIQGHLLFAFRTGNQTAYYEDGGYTLDFTGVEQGKPIEVTVNWCWPKTWEDAKASRFGSVLTGWQAEHFDWLFYQEVPSGQDSFTDEQLSAMYDAADQYIGGDQQKNKNAMYAIGLRLTGDKLS